EVVVLVYHRDINIATVGWSKDSLEPLRHVDKTVQHSSHCSHLPPLEKGQGLGSHRLVSVPSFYARRHKMRRLPAPGVGLSEAVSSAERFVLRILRHPVGAAVRASESFPLLCFGFALGEQRPVGLSHLVIQGTAVCGSEYCPQLPRCPHEPAGEGFLLRHDRLPFRSDSPVMFPIKSTLTVSALTIRRARDHPRRSNAGHRRRRSPARAAIVLRAHRCLAQRGGRLQASPGWTWTDPSAVSCDACPVGTQPTNAQGSGGNTAP